MNTPQLRFSDFKGEWSNNELKDLLSLIKDGSHGTHTDVNDGPYLLSAKNILNGMIHFDNTDRKISIEDYNSIYKNYRLKIGDILLSIVGTIGRTAIVQTEELIAFQRSVAILRGENMYPLFLLYLFQTPNFQKQLKVKQVVSAQPGLYLGDLSKIRVYTPQFQEQQLIGNFFNKLNKKIQLQQEKIDLLKEQKKGYLNKFFSDLSTFNKAPFFENIERVFDYRGRTPKKLNMEWGNGDIIALSANNVKNGYIDLNAECYFASESLYNKWMTNGDLKRNDILFTMEAPLGNVATVPDDSKYILSQRVVAFRTKADKLDSTYFYQFLRSPFFKNELTKYSTGTTATGISQRNLEKMEVFIPPLNQQKQIGLITTKLDEKINKEVLKLELLKQQKQSFMQQMFI